MPPAGETLEQARQCAKCGAVAMFVEECVEPCYSQGECVSISCAGSSCRESWSYCNSCKKRFKSSRTDHASRKRHKKNHDLSYLEVPGAAVAPATAPTAEVAAETNNATNDDINDANDAMGSEQLMDAEEVSSAVAGNAEGSMDGANVIGKGEPEAALSSFPLVSLKGNEWLEELLKSKKPATADDLHALFAGPELGGIKNFWLGELASGPGRCGGGIMYLVAKAFQQVRDSQLDKTKFPTFKEAMFQFANLLQYQSMNEKQRRRHCQITEAIMSEVTPGGFFQQTFVPNYSSLGRYYGATGLHSIWQNAPSPKAKLVHGVAYLEPKVAISFLFANGVPVDDIVIRRSTLSNTETGDADVDSRSRRIHHIEDAPQTVERIREIQKEYWSEDPGAPNFGAPKEEAVILAVLSCWKDGFGPSKVKNNRGSVDIKTITLSPPKTNVNGTGNTCAVGLGLKNSHKGWNAIEKMFNKDLKELCSTTQPTYFFHGVLQKVVPVFFLRAASLADKVEKGFVTGTLSYSSDIHRTYGYLGAIQTPSCKTAELKAFFGTAQPSKWGWSDTFIHPNRNGSRFMACRTCRKKGLEKMGVLDACEPFLDSDDEEECNECANWDVMCKGTNDEGERFLDFPKHNDYPRKYTEGSPVDPPTGRDVFDDSPTLQFVELSWDMMTQASKFAFYQASRKTGSWSKGQTVCYLKYCGVAPKVGDLIASSALLCKKEKRQADIDYDDDEGIDDLEFPAAWLSDLSVFGFIETIMHLLNLGIAQSNFDLITMWLKTLPPGKTKMSSAGFRSAMQPLLKDLKPFMLAWLQAYPFTGDGHDLKTGAWVAENWLTVVRISKIFFGYCNANEVAQGYGGDDVSRMVICFHALVARLLTHSGIDEAMIDEIDLYIREFLSCVKEVDIRVRHKELNKDITKVSQRKGTEAYWMKSNYMCLRNLVTMMKMLGPLVLWWDGGGKGERYIQCVKPHIQRGIRDDVQNFFVNLMEKLYKVMQVQLLAQRYGVDDSSSPDDLQVPALSENHTAGLNSVVDILEEVADAFSDAESDDEASHLGLDDDSAVPGEGRVDEEDVLEMNEAYVSTEMEDHGMTKTKTIYVYRDEQKLDEAIESLKPIAGFVSVTTVASGETAFEFEVVFRKPVKQFARRQIKFDDDNGWAFNGLWWAGITVDPEQESVPPTGAFSDIQSVAKLSAVAIPLCYVIGYEKANSSKYCVITNWWKERQQDGSYGMPELDPDLYHTADDDGEEQSNVASSDGDEEECSTTDDCSTNSTSSNLQDTNRGNNRL